VYNRVIITDELGYNVKAMVERITRIWNHERTKQLTDPRNIGLYVFGVVVLAIAWSGVRTVQVNYELEKKVSRLKQENIVLQLQNQNTDLQNRYLGTDEFLELSARQTFGLAAPGETVWVVPKDVALKYVDKSSRTPKSELGKSSVDDRPSYIKNLEAWRDFLLGRSVSED